MPAILRRLLILLACLFVARLAHADTDIALFKSFAGNVNFVGAEKTLRKASNNTDPCSIYSASETTTATLRGIPASAKILSAQLYWAASGTTTDYQVTFDGTPITAPANRQYTSATVGYDFFSGAYDITAQVTAKRNASYTFKDLSITNSSKWCNVQGVVGGWAMLVVYSLPTETFRVLNIYEGFKYIQNSSISLTLSNFEIPPLTSGQTGRVAHITWEGDDTLGSTTSQGEFLTFNGTSMSNATNPAGNQFNSKSTIDGIDEVSYGIDFDSYTVSSPIIKAGQTSATTVYRSDQDLVLLSVEVISVPNTPVTDLGITLSRDQTLALGQTAIYTASVKNYGPAADPGTVQVVDDLPANLGYVYGGGDGWSCSVSGQRVTCNYTQPLDVGATAPPLEITVMVKVMAASISNTVTVSGSQFDNQMNNNTATDTSNVTVPPYVFTNAVCSNNVAFGTASQCGFINWNNAIAGDVIGPFYITLLNSSGVPTRASTSVDTTISVRFGMSCVNPATGSAELAYFPDSATQLPKCADNGATPASWSGYKTYTVKANEPTARTAITFNYYDVGRVRLYMQDNAQKLGGSGSVVMKPLTVDMEVFKTVAGVRTDNPAATVPSGPKFVAAGEPFTIQVGVRTRDKNGAKYFAQNFGRESPARTVDFSLIAGEESAGVTFPEMAKDPADPDQALELTGSLGAFSLGRSSGTFSFGEVGIIKATASMKGNDYLGTGSVGGSSTNIGRFTPDHFNTVLDHSDALGPIMPCTDALNCSDETAGMVYSQRPFNVVVTAYDVNNNLLQNYRGRFSRDIYLCGAGNQTLSPPAGGICPAVVAGTVAPAGSLRSGTTLPVLAADPNRPPKAYRDAMSATINYYLPNPYNAAAASAAASGQTQPTLIYVRATDTDGVSSLYGVSPARDLVEGSVVVVNGRVFLPNVFGSELQYLPVNFKAQYWSGTQWVLSSQDGSNVIDTSRLVFSNCKKNLAASGTVCKNVLGAMNPAVIALSQGQGRFLLSRTGAGNAGTADFRFSDPANTDPLNWTVWLPTTIGRATFGVYRNSPVTYVRELY